MNSPAFSICVYCGSKSGSDDQYAQEAIAVGQWIGQHGGRLVYGGGRNGLMGLVADATLQAGGQVLGIIPQALVEKEWAHTGCSELVVVQTMHERKQQMADAADAFLALPGGIGTFEEFFEAWTWRQLGYHDKPVGLLNTAGYYDRMLDFLAHSVESGFMGDWQTNLIKVGSSCTFLLPELVQDAGMAPAARTDLM